MILMIRSVHDRFRASVFKTISGMQINKLKNKQRTDSGEYRYTVKAIPFASSDNGIYYLRLTQLGREAVLEK